MSTREKSKGVSVRRYVSSCNYDLDGLTLVDAATWLREQARIVKAQYPDVIEIKLSWDSEEWGEGYVLNVVGYAPENDKEREVRLAREADAKAQRTEYERREYERLSRKYGSI